jgi:hypothetical protein
VMKIVWTAALVLKPAAVAAKPTGQAAHENRCGWIVNPTPANWTLADRGGEWQLGVQGGYQAPGLDEVPDLTTRHWVVTNGSSYGYGCGCMLVDVDRAKRRVARIYSVKQKTLAVCRADRHLKRPL